MKPAAALVLVVCMLCAACQTAPKMEKVTYPPSAKGNVVDTYFGVQVPDPYRWMEDLESKPVADWVAAQNGLSSAYLAKLPLRETFKKRMTELWDYPKTGLPWKEGGKYFYSKNSGLQRQAPLYMRATLDAAPTMILDPNTLSPDGSISLGAWQPSRDGKLLAYGLSQGGADWNTIHLRDLSTGKDLPDVIKWFRFAEVSWTNDNKGFFYERYPEPPKGKELAAALAGHAVYYHRVGTSQSEDTLILQRKDLPTWFVGAYVTEDGRYVFFTLNPGANNNNRLYYADLGDPMHPKIGAPIKPIFEKDGAEFSPVGNNGSTVFVRSDQEAPNRKIVAVDVLHPEPSVWKTIVPESKQSIERASVIGGRMIVQYLVDVQSRLAVFGLDGSAKPDIKMPSAGTVEGFSGRSDEPEMFFSFDAPVVPETAFRENLDTGERTTFDAANPAFDPSNYETTPLFATSKDGTRVPFFLTARKGVKKNGDNPAVLYGYGGFSVSLTPWYAPNVPAWLERGGLWITANMRGGAEYGEAWHKGGMIEKKQNVFDDFIAVAEYLVKEKYTSPQRLAITGASNGGLLVGAVLQQRPDLFAAALPGVGVMDMLRYDKFTGGAAWRTEYGSSSVEDQFKYLIKYSPLHNAKPGVCYPATLVTTADHDDRVVPSHSFKFTAAMQTAQACDKPILIRVETQGSHGYRPTDKQIEELADKWAFTAAATGMK